jgi:hypothetical protein
VFMSAPSSAISTSERVRLRVCLMEMESREDFERTDISMVSSDIMGAARLVKLKGGEISSARSQWCCRSSAHDGEISKGESRHLLGVVVVVVVGVVHGERRGGREVQVQVQEKDPIHLSPYL